ncbi:uncharacterized protein L969DRAFT_85241 [Mixia osmundae IAM 14324]|uniref:Amino acid transporter transmembrane domain-containing protein n=1 Tax=Mixia osmundae (strain CBS 9802 / IAM 14324 / JCM 22182 / KY 12970) TaxID=764103 RepID=G7DY92_MIXOS|nr:uncharacterized protein L969DRAFT_85241 [Mixia osmundae IAM 14324]KEI41455.1 hypothetical protein L969DRAFT_85241 [Mixia osmundae IAM 14324]GAA95552.1 hypothetical protein E5Q_02207 [Mixia osmundae IAM 14324]
MAKKNKRGKRSRQQSAQTSPSATTAPLPVPETDSATSTSHQAEASTSQARPSNAIPLSSSSRPRAASPLAAPSAKLASSPAVPNIPPRASYSSTPAQSRPISQGSLEAKQGSVEDFNATKRALPAGPSRKAVSPSALGQSLAEAKQQDKNSSSISIASSNNALPSASRPDEMSDAHKARILRMHLVNRSDQTSPEASTPRRASDSNSQHSERPKPKEDDYFSGNKTDEIDAPPPAESSPAAAEEGVDPNSSTYHNLLGGDVTHDLYKWEQQAQQAQIRRPRSLSFSGAEERANGGERIDPTLDIRNIREPGGFRRNFLHRRAAEDADGDAPPRKFTRSFVDFLSLHGHFYGEDLEEIDERDEDEIAQVLAFEEQEAGHAGTGARARFDIESRELATERTALLKRQSLRRGESKASIIRKHRAGSTSTKGDATVTQAVLMLLKSFVGTGVLFLGKAFFNGGILFSALLLVGIAAISLYSFLLLVKTRLVIKGGFGEIGGILYGPWLRYAILFSITISQIGFVAVYTTFTAQNLQAFVQAVTDCRTLISIPAFIAMQLVIFIPFALVRNLQKLSGTALLADAFILVGVIYIFGNEINILARHGIADVVLFNSDSFTLMIGTAVFAFEGIGLIIPITESMKEPERFPAVLSCVMVFLAILFGGAGVLSYAAYGSKIQTVVMVNLPQDSRAVNVVQLLYSLAIMLSTPLQLFPAVRIMENGLFSSSGKYSNRVKWQKNTFRVSMVVFCMLVAWLGSNDLDKFVSLIGSLACVPLCFCYPALLHYRACAKTRRQKATDIALCIFGVIVTLFTTFNTIRMLATEQSGGPPSFGNCPAPSS